MKNIFEEDSRRRTWPLDEKDPSRSLRGWMAIKGKK